MSDCAAVNGARDADPARSRQTMAGLADRASHPWLAKVRRIESAPLARHLRTSRSACLRRRTPDAFGVLLPIHDRAGFAGGFPTSGVSIRVTFACNPPNEFSFAREGPLA